MDLGRGIGFEGSIPWRLPADLRRFRELSMGKPVVMGRRTHESIKKALPGRLNVVLSRNKDYRPAEGCVVHRTMRDALLAIDAEGHPEAMIIGGEEVYRRALLDEQVDTVYLTHVLGAFKADTWFPKELDTCGPWEVAVEGGCDEVAAHGDKPAQPACVFLRCERRR
jgi:dihydrofolate reductase